MVFAVPSLAAAIPSAISIGSQLFGGNKSAKRAQGNFEAIARMQREFAQNGIRWKVADAKAAGIHPLFALGGNTATFSPPAIPSGNSGPDFGQIGQDLSRAIGATQNSTERLQDRLLESQITNQELNNDLLRLQRNRLNGATQLGPPMPGPGPATQSQLNADGGAYGYHVIPPRGYGGPNDAISWSFLEPPGVNPDGSRYTTLGDDQFVLDRNSHPLERAEQLHGEFGSLGPQAVTTMQSAWEWIERNLPNNPHDYPDWWPSWAPMVLYHQ